MLIKSKTLVLCLLLLAGCGSSTRSGEQSDNAAPLPSPKNRLTLINGAYSGNGIQAKREWGGKRVTVGGAFDSSGRNADGTVSILVSPGDMPPTLGEFNVGRKQDDFVAGLKKGDEVAMDCTVDPEHEGFTTTFLDCLPSKS